MNRETTGGHGIRPLAVLAISLIVVACSPSPTPSPVALVSPTEVAAFPTLIAPPVSTSAPTPSAAPTETPGPSPPSPAFAWQRGELPDAASAASVDTALGGFVVSGQDPYGKDLKWWSPDGLTWRRLRGVPGTVVCGDGTSLGGLALDCAGLSGTCTLATIWRSVDGTHWRRGSLDVAGAVLEDVAGDGHHFVAIGRTCRPRSNVCPSLILASSDGRRWRQTIKVRDTRNVTFTGLRKVGRWFVVFGSKMLNPGASVMFAKYGPLLVWTSPDGRTWSRGVNLADLSSGNPVMTFVIGPALFVSGSGDDGASDVWTSTDGATWVQAPHQAIFDNGVRATIDTGHGLIALAAGVWVSSDGLNWVLAPDLPAPPALHQAMATDGRRVVVLTCIDSGCETWTSPLPQ